MTQKHYISMSMNVRARMTIADEIRRQKRLGLEVINEKVIEGLIEQRQYLEKEQTKLYKNLVVLVFLSFIAWQGVNIKIPGAGISIADVPAFLEISLVLSSIYLMWLPYVFINIQSYDAVIQSIVKQITTKNLIDEEIVVASKLPVQLFCKYARDEIVFGRENGFKMSTLGKIYNGLLISLVLFSFFLVFLFLFVSVIIIAHQGLDSGFTGWSVYLLCWFLILVGVFAISASFVNFKYEMDFENLERIEQTEGRSTLDK